MTTETIQINIREDGSRLVVVNINAVANASANAQASVNGFTNALRSIGAVYAIKELVQMADTVTLLDARLKLATKTTEEYTQAQADLYRISQTNNVGLVETTKLYTKLFEPVRALGGGLNEVSAIVDGFSTALRIGGANTQEAAAATLQFAQALSKGKLDGDEFKTLAETAPRFMRAMADGMGVATGELKGMASQGKLTADVIGNALIGQLKTLKAEAAGLSNTVGGAMSDLSNDTLIAVGAFDKLTGMTANMSDVIQGVSLIVFELANVFRDELKDGSEQTNNSFESMTVIIRGLGTVMETLLILGSDVSHIFKTVGRNIGGFVAQLAAIADGDFAGVSRIQEMIVKDGEVALKELERYQGRVLGMTDKALAKRDKIKANGGVIPEDDIDFVTLKQVASEKDLMDVRMKMAGINKGYFKDMKTLEDNFKAGNIPQKEYVDLMSELATKTYEASAAGRAFKKSQRGNAGDDDRMKTIQDQLVTAKTAFQQEESIYAQRERMLDTYYRNFNTSDQEYYAGRETARAEFIAAEAISFAKERAIMESFKPKNGREAADEKLRLNKLLQEHEEFKNKMAGLRTDDELAQLASAKTIQDNSNDAMNKYLSGQYETLENLKEVTQAREVSKSSIERENVAIYEQAVANMRLQASLPVTGDRTQADQDHAIATLAFLEQQLALSKGITGELEKQEAMKASDTAAKRAIEDWKNAGKDIADSMSTTFGAVGNAIGQVMDIYAQSVADQLAANKRLKDSTKGMVDGDPRKIKAINDMKTQSAKDQIKSYADMAGAAKGFFKENTKGYRIMEAAEKGYRAVEIAMALESMVQKIFFKESEVAANLALNATKTTGEVAATGVSTGLAATEASAWGITAVVKALASLPFPANLAAGAATLAAVVAIGATMMGGLGGAGDVDVAKERQAKTGTGSVLGDNDAKSDSIRRSIELAASNSNIELTHTAGMLRALLSIENSMSNVGDLLIRSGNLDTSMNPDDPGSGAKNAGGKLAVSMLGGFMGLAVDKLFGGKLSATIEKIMPKFLTKAIGKVGNAIFGGKITGLDTGITAGQSTVGQIGANGLSVSQYSDTKKDGGLFRSDKYRTELKSLGGEANSQFGMIVTGIAESITAAADILGVGGPAFQQRLNSFVVDIGKISVKDLKPEEIQAQLNAAFSKIGDDMARFAVSSVKDFQKAGEGYLETLVRVASNFANTMSVFEALGKPVEKLIAAGPIATERLVELAGGIDELAGRASSFAENFMTEGERLAPVAAYVAKEMAKLGYAGITTRDQFKELVLGIDASTVEGAALFTQLMALESMFAKTHAATKDLTLSEQAIADQREDLQARYDELTMSAIQMRAKERAAIASQNRPLYDQVAAREDLAAAYEKESAALQTVIEGLADFQRNTLSFRDGLAFASTSTLTPMERAAEAERQYNETLIKAQAGDKNAQAGIQASANQYLTATQLINASSEKQNGIFEKVRDDMTKLAATAGVQLSDAQLQLDAMNKQVTGIITLNDTMISFKDALLAVMAADRVIAPIDIPGMGTPAITPLIGTLDGLRADNAKLLDDNVKLRAAINDQTQAVVEATREAARLNAEATNEGAERAARTRNWKIDVEAQETVR